MTGITLDSDQIKACELIKEWFNELNKPFFVLSGYAGTGKTFLINYVVSEILKLQSNEVAYITPTGKAACVLIQQGRVEASTLHKLIYDANQIEELKNVNGIEVIEKRVEFTRKDFLPEHLKLIVLDEISMVKDEVFKDLLFFNIPVICAGDDAQLPPVGEGFCSVLDKPNIKLTQIHRQDRGSQIIDIAHKVRCGEHIRPGIYGDEVAIISKKNLTEEKLNELILNSDQILCGTNKTRNNINKQYRKLKGLDSTTPQKGEKLIATLNNWNITLDNESKYNLVNGIIGTCEGTQVYRNKYGKMNNNLIEINFMPDFIPNITYSIISDNGIFKDGEFYFDMHSKVTRTFDNIRSYDLINRFDYGYAISVHKAQGSQFDTVLLFDESYAFGENKNKWLYTAITRARKNIVILR